MKRYTCIERFTVLRIELIQRMRAVSALVATSFFIFGAAMGGQKKSAPKPLRGSDIFKSKCASCHGEKGQGGAGFSKPLAGKLSQSELALFIRKSMPPGGPKLSEQDSKSVGDFVYTDFYSPIAQERIRPPRIEVARLTVRQFKNCIADLLGSGQNVRQASLPDGLRAKYFKSKNFDEKTKVLDRIDPKIQFDFGSQGPVPGDFDPYNFSIHWQGSVLAPDSGSYEFIIKSDNAVRLFVNGQKPVIDAFVRSGNETEFHVSVNLLAGRFYPIRLEFSKATQGVEDPKRQKQKPPGHANVELQWKRPKQTAEVIPERFLFSQDSPTTFVSSIQFPPDDRSMGFERGNSVSKEWDEATTNAAIEAATYVSENFHRIARVAENDPQTKERARDYCKKFASRAFRRPLDLDSEALYVTKQFEKSPTIETAIKRSVMLILMSPRFLYREIGGAKGDDFQIASNISFGMWDSLPDVELSKLAQEGKLGSQEVVSKQAERMIADPRAWAKVEEFLWLWLKVEDVPEIVKSPKVFPGFDQAITTQLRNSMELFLENMAWKEEGGYRDLFLSSKVYLNGKLAPFYGFEMSQNAPFQPVDLDGGKRSGVLSQPYLLARLGYLESSSPIHRGVLIVRNFLGRTLNPPPSAFAPEPASLHPNLSTRERIALQTKPEMCNNCHGIINPIGFTLETYDAIGKIRTLDNGKKVDTSGVYRTLAGSTVKFSNSQDLAKFIADSPEAQQAFVEKFFLNMVKQPIRAYGKDTISDLHKSFVKNGQSIRKLMVQVITKSAGV